MSKTLSELIMSDTSTGMWTREDWQRLGRGELSELDEKEILADGYEAIIE